MADRTQPIKPSITKQIKAAFADTALDADQRSRIEEVSRALREVSFLVARTSLASREQNLALRHLEEARQWYVAGVARNEVGGAEPGPAGGQE